MKRPISMLRKLRQDRGGVVAVLVALSMPVLIGSAALTIDISYFRHVQGLLQSAADSGALAGIGKLDTPTGVADEAINYTKRNVPENFGDVTTAGDVQIGIWDPDSKVFTPSNSKDVNAVRVTARRDEARGNGMTTILLQYFNQDAPNVAATATAARHLIVQYEPPEKTDLDNEAWDYNRLYAYCFNYSGTGPASNRRSQMTLISDNVAKSGSGVSNFWTEAKKRGFDKVPTFVWPECAKGESLSFRLENIRVVKQNINDTKVTNANWANFDKNVSGNTFNHHTDTVIASGVESFPGLTQSILETKRCDSSDLCDPNKPGNVIPKGRNRTPEVSGEPCMPGKFMYFGWEDRPPTGGSDKDYDDIRILMRCPKTGRLGDGISRLVG